LGILSHKADTMSDYLLNRNGTFYYQRRIPSGRWVGVTGCDVMGWDKKSEDSADNEWNDTTLIGFELVRAEG
jgi:hypothetical protein